MGKGQITFWEDKWALRINWGYDTFVTMFI